LPQLRPVGGDLVGQRRVVGDRPVAGHLRRPAPGDRRELALGRQGLDAERRAQLIGEREKLVLLADGVGVGGGRDGGRRPGVAGGGPAGLGAALAAARHGARVCLLERYGFLGGNFTVASVGTICGLYVAEGGSWAYVTRGIAEEVAEGLKGTGAANGPIPFKGTAVLLYVPWAAKRLFDRLVGEQ